MFLYIILFSVVLQSITCDFPPYITRCPLPDPNANDCLLNSARIAEPYVAHGDPELGLPDIYDAVYINGDRLILEYNYPNNNSEIQLNGQINVSNDTYLHEASINLNWPNWHFLLGGSKLQSYFDFILTIYEESGTMQAKGQISILQDNWKLTYSGDYVKQEIDNVIYMQISWAYAYMSDDTFEIEYTGLSTLDDEPITGPELIRVKKALRNFENSFHNKESEIGEDAFTHGLNTILKLVPESEVFLPAPNPCPQNE